jgi:hypothetical protein
MKSILLDSFFYRLNSRLGGMPLSSQARDFFEIKNIKLHLKITEARLKAADISHLNAEQAEKRLTALKHLNDYIRAEKFPRNFSKESIRSPYFKDAKGALCAMAYLVAMSGRNDIVKKIYDENNEVYITENLTGDLADWISENGLSKKEAALVQPTYGPGFPGYSDYNYTTLETLLQYSGIIIGAIVFVGLWYLSHILIASLNLSKGKRLLVFVYFTLINLLIAFILGGFAQTVLWYPGDIF